MPKQNPIKNTTEKERCAVSVGLIRAPLFHARPVAVAALGLLIGLLLGDGLTLVFAMCAILVLLIAAFGAKLLKKTIWVVFLLSVAAGFLRVALAAPGEIPAGDGVLQGRICETPEVREDGEWRVQLRDATLSGAPIPGRIKLYARFAEPPAYGQIVSVDADVLPSADEYRLYDRYRSVFSVAFAYGEAVVLWQSPPDAYGQLLSLRADIGGRISQLFYNAPGEAKGMMLGDKSDIGEETLAAFQNTGVAHLLAVSGLHVSLLAAAFSLLFRRNAWVRFFAVATFCALYAALTAFSPPVVRSGVMMTIGLLAFPLRRRLDAPSALSAAFVLILLVNPYALWSAGFQLSFVAVLSLILLAPLFQKPLARLGSVASGLIGASTAVVVGTLPTRALFFGQAQLLSIVTNLFVIPLAGVFLVPAFLGVLLSYVWHPLGSAVCWVGRTTLDVILAVAQFGGSITLTLPPPPAASYLLWLGAMLFASRLCLASAKRRALFAGLLFAASAALWALL